VVLTSLKREHLFAGLYVHFYTHVRIRAGDIQSFPMGLNAVAAKGASDRRRRLVPPNLT
jgi:hypothetical protein